MIPDSTREFVTQHKDNTTAVSPVAWMKLHIDAPFKQMLEEAKAMKQNNIYIQHTNSIGNDPKIMGFAPCKSIQTLLDQTKLAVNDIDLYELNEAFSAQSIAIQNEIILGLEASEGTDELIKRCFKYKKKGDQGVIIKLSKYKQNKVLDIPAIGINTMRLLKKYKFEGIFLELNKCLIINKEKVIKYANQNNLFITSVKKN